MNKLQHIILPTTLLLFSLITHAGLKPGEAAPSFDLPSLDGPRVSLNELSSKGHVMLVFWESECVYCFMHIPELNALHEKYVNKGLVIAAINFLGEHEATVKEYASENHIKYMMLTDRSESIDVASHYKVIGSPTIVVIGPGQKVLYYGHKLPDIGNWIK